MAAASTCFMLFVFASHHTWAAEGKDKGKFAWVRRGESFTMRCSTLRTDGVGLYLKWGLHQDKDVLYLSRPSNKLNVMPDYRSRVDTQGNFNSLSITISNMTEDDTGVYWCMYTHMDENTDKSETTEGSGSSLVVVNGKPCATAEVTALTPTLVMVTGISAASVLLLCLTVLFFWLVPRMKKLSARKRHTFPRRSDSVYEDMRKNNTARRGQPGQAANHFP